MKTLPFILLLFFLQCNFMTSAQLFGPKVDTISKVPIVIKFDLTRTLYSITSWQPSVDVRLLRNLSFETELNFYSRYSFEDKGDMSLGAMRTQFLKKPNFFVTGILKLHAEGNGAYVGLRGGVGQINVEFQRYVCFETIPSVGGLCQCTDWADVHVVRKMKQYFLGGRFGYKAQMGDHIILDFYMDVTSVKYVYPVELPLIDAYCDGHLKVKNPFDELPIKSDNFADKMFWLKSGETSGLLQIGLKIGYAF